MIVLVVASVLLAALPAVMLLVNLRLYRAPPLPGEGVPAIQVPIPARNGAASITAAVEPSTPPSAGWNWFGIRLSSPALSLAISRS